MKKVRLIFIRWGRGVRRFKVKNFQDYEKVGKKGRFNVYAKKKRSKSLNRITKKRKVTKKEESFIERIKGVESGVDIEKEKLIERKLLKKVQIMPNFNRKKYIKQINPKREIVSNGKTYGSFYALDNAKRDVYLDLMKGLFTAKDQRFKNKLYALRRELLKDGIVIEVDVYGKFSSKGRRNVFLGTLGIVGLMVEDAGFIETEMIGWFGENRIIEMTFDRIVKSRGGEKCYWMKNNMNFDTEQVYITNVNLRLSYA